MDIDAVRKGRPANEVYYFPTIGSTMTEAAKLAEAGSPHGTAVIADEQTAGFGRLGRAWVSPAASGIYASILLRLKLDPASSPIASLLVGLATADAIQKTTNLLCDLRWPNDVLIGERKVAGILTQLIDDCIIAGIGINVNQLSFPADLRTPATSLRIESNGREQAREPLLIQLLESLEHYCQKLWDEGVKSIVRDFSAASSYARHRRIVIEETGSRGVTTGLDEHGFLMVRYDNGLTQRLAAGGVRPEK